MGIRGLDPISSGLGLEDLWPWPRRPLALASKISGLGLDHVVLEHIPVNNLCNKCDRK